MRLSVQSPRTYRPPLGYPEAAVSFCGNIGAMVYLGTAALTWLIILLLRYKQPQGGRERWMRWYGRIYLQSWHWKRYRTVKLFLARYKCQKCHRQVRPLHLHHLTYKRLWRERLSDTLVLCVKCHSKTHGRTL